MDTRTVDVELVQLKLNRTGAFVPLKQVLAEDLHELGALGHKRRHKVTFV